MKWILFLTLYILSAQICVAPTITKEQVYDQELQWQENHRVTQLKAKIDTADFTPELLYQALVLYVQDPDIVFNQSKLETGWFKSSIFLQLNNAFGMHYPLSRETTAIGWRWGDYYGGSHHKISKYNHWSDGVKDVALWQQYWKDKGKQMDDYYQFLNDLPYATAKRYIYTLKLMEI